MKSIDGVMFGVLLSRLVGERPLANAPAPPEFEKATLHKAAWRLIPFLLLCYIIAFLDRVNVGFAKLQMADDLAFSDAVYGFGAGVFFIGYFIFEVPSNAILAKVGARVWIARIMISWGFVSAAMMFAGDLRWGGLAAQFGLNDAEFSFYFLRFLLGVAEAGFFPGVILYLTYWFPGAQRARMVALFMTGIQISNLIGSPISGAIMQFTDGAAGMRGWQWLFLLEAIPAVVVGALALWLLPDGPKSARWLTEEERDCIVTLIAKEDAAKEALGKRRSFFDAFKDPRVWALSLCYFCGVVCFYGVNFWMPTLIQEFGIDKNDYLSVGLLSMIPWGTAALVGVAWAAHSDRTGERRWHSAGGLMLALTGLLMLAVVGHNGPASMAALTLVTTGVACWVATFWSLPTAFLSGGAAAAGIAWINSIGNLGGHFGPDLIGRVRDASGGASEAAFFALAAAALLGILIILVLPKAQPLR